MKSGDIARIVETTAYLVLRLRSAGKRDDEVMAEVRATVAAAASPEEAVDALAAEAEKNAAQLRARLDNYRDGPAGQTSG